MFKRRDKPAPATPAREPFTYIHHGTTLKGELEGKGRVRIHGTVRGNVRVDGVLEVAEAGRVEGTWIVADEVKIIGRVQVESLTAHGKVEIWRGGELIGDVTATSLDIEEGARFTGRSQMSDQLDDGNIGVGDGLRSPERGRQGSGQSDPAPDVGVETQPLTSASTGDISSTPLELLGQSDHTKF